MLHGSRYLEVSHRNRQSRLFMGRGSCHNPYMCDDVCIELRPRGWKKCRPQPSFNACGKPLPEPLCPDKFVLVCADFNEDGWATFTWPKEALNMIQGFYEGVLIIGGCETDQVLPVLVGAHRGASIAESIPTNIDGRGCVACDEDECDHTRGDCGCDSGHADNQQIRYVQTYI